MDGGVVEQRRREGGREMQAIEVVVSVVALDEKGPLSELGGAG